jgi:N6-adenosine-specific RNA methylase IME4
MNMRPPSASERKASGAAGLPARLDFPVQPAAPGGPRTYHDVASLFAARGYPPPHPYALLWPLLPKAEQEMLTESIRKSGVRSPILVVLDDTGTEQIVDGIARCLSAIEAGIGWEQLPKRTFKGDAASLLDAVIDANAKRRHLDASQRAMVAARLATMKQGARTDRPHIAQICARSQSDAAALLNVSRTLVQAAAKIQNCAVPEIQNAIDNGLLPVSVAVLALKFSPDQQREVAKTAFVASKPSEKFHALVRELNTNAKHNRVISNARHVDLGAKRYPLGLFDPPWKRRISRVGAPFPQLSVEEIGGFKINGRPICDVIADEAIIFLWILDVLLFDLERPIERICESWGGLTPSHLLLWPKLAMATGNHARYQHEHCLVLLRGKFPPPPEELRGSTLIVGPPLPESDGFQFAQPYDAQHSSKPPRLQEMIEQTYPQYFGPETVDNPLALELFARNHRRKWDGHGYEYPGRPDLEADEREPAHRIIVPRNLQSEA